MNKFKQQVTEQVNFIQPEKKIMPSHSEKSVFNFENAIGWLEKRGKQQFGEQFKIYESDYEIIYKLMIYFQEDKLKCEKYNINLKKGILLSGPVGCGKTTLMHLMRYFSKPEKSIL